MKQTAKVLAMVFVLGLVFSIACKKKDKTPPPGATTTTKPDTIFGTFTVYVDTFNTKGTAQSGAPVFVFSDSARMDSAIKAGNPAGYQYTAITSVHSDGIYASLTLPLDPINGTTYWLLASVNYKKTYLSGDTSFKYKCQSCVNNAIVIVR